MTECSTRKVTVVIDVQESLDGRLAGRETIGQQLDGDIAVEGSSAGTVSDARAAAAELVDQLVARRAGRRIARLGGSVPERSGMR